MLRYFLHALFSLFLGRVFLLQGLALQVEYDIAPYHGLLLGLFLMTVGMSIDPKFLVSNFPVILGTLGLLIGGKGILVASIGRLFSVSMIAAIRVGLLLPLGGEFTIYLLMERLLIRYLMGFIYFTVANLVLSLVATVLCVMFAPTAAGSSIPEIKAYLNGVDTPNMFGAPQFVVKIIGSICAVSAGLDQGNERPLVHIGYCIASLLGQGGPDKHRLKWR
ncbi:hypothetical protein IFM89_037952 [Coptis chinensis]|uniref:Uncharacterized protein n=1 Tax=Coptis chinensis TaxID=261450 RepID=A0A835LQ12_9MAGN|nr:hypothetical protein IFM89_037952 [Coptis chinensis]